MRSILLCRNLYNTFASPFADSPSRPQDIGEWCFLNGVIKIWRNVIALSSFSSPPSLDCSVPQEYLIHPYIREKVYYAPKSIIN